MFFKNLEISILNYLQSKFNKADQTVQNSKNLFTHFNENSTNQINNSDMSEIINVKFPINNAEFSYMIIDANLGIKENLNNIFFLEFDLTKEQNKNLREISNENVERELFFVLNGMIHDVPLFSSDLKFSVETRKFIKSIQFRLETYKNELIQLKKSKSKSETNTTIPVRNTFFGKVLSNTNLGIEFHKPHLYFFI